MELKAVSFGNGEVTFYSEVEETPTTTTKSGNVTVNNVGRPGVPAYFEVQFMLNCQYVAGQIDAQNIFHFRALVTDKGRDTSYAEVEAEGARLLAPMLREIADNIEKQVAEFDSKAGKS